MVTRAENYELWLKETKTSRMEYQRKHRTPDKNRNGYMKCVFGITLDEYNILFEEQGGVCAICKFPETRKRKNKDGTYTIRRLSIDHCHTTGKIRGLLCGHCNSGLGMFEDSFELLEAAIGYLRK